MQASNGNKIETHDELSGRVMGYATGALTTSLINIGDKLGLYAGLKDTGPCTSKELADNLSLDERWVREWLFQQASAKLVTSDAEAHKFWLTKTQEDVLVNEYGPDASPYYLAGLASEIPPCFWACDKLVEAFKTGKGLAYDEYGQELAIGVCRELNVWVRHFMLEKFCTIDGLKEKLTEGALVADIGCGCGEALILIAEAFPNSTFHGYDISKHALKEAKQKLAESKLTNVKFFNPGEGEELPTTPTYDFMFTFDAIHDMARPDVVIKNIRGALKDDSLGYLICDFETRDTPGQNIQEDPDASALFYGYSVHVCMSSALSEPHGMGLGTLGLTRAVAKKLLDGAGFSGYSELDFDRPEMRFMLATP